MSSCFCVNGEKISFSWPDFVDSEIDFYKSSTFVRKTKCVRLSKENLICSNNAPKIHILNYWRHQKLLVPNQLQDSTFLFEINNEDIGISKLASQSKLLSSLFKLEHHY